MAIVVRSNSQSVFAQNRLNASQASFNSSLEKLASGARINRAADDAAGMAISTSLEHRMVGQNAALRNAQEGISMIQTAEGGVDQVRSMLDRMRELAVRASSETLNDTDRGNAAQEFDQLVGEINRISSTTDFNGKNLLSATLVMTFQVGHQNVTANQLKATITGGMGAGSLGVSGQSVSSAAGAQSALSAISGALSTLNTYRSKLGAVQNRLERSISNLEADIENTTAANSRIRDVDFAAETAAFTRSQILVQSGTAILAQANSAPQAALSLLG
jgi:flagellin